MTRFASSPSWKRPLRALILGLLTLALPPLGAPALAAPMGAAAASPPAATAPITNPITSTERWESLADTVFQNYGRDQGLPHPVPTALAQDHEGFLWVGTQSGIARWDGYRFRAYRPDPARPDALPDGWIQTLHVDPLGRLWVGTSAGGLARYDAARDVFVPVPLGHAPGRLHIGAIADDGKGGLWLGSDAGLEHLDPATGEATAVRAGMARAEGLPDGRVQALLLDRAGTLWVGTLTGLAYAPPGGGGFVTIPLGPVAIPVSALYQDPDGRIWIGTQQRGLLVIDKPGQPPRPVGAGSHLPSGSVSAICQQGPHEIWASLRGGGIVAVDTTTGRVRPIRHDRTLANSLAHDDVWALMRDDTGAMWVGSTGGLSYHPPDSGLFTTVFGASDRPGGMSAADVLSILATRDGRLWLGYLDGGADLIDPVAGRVLALRPGAGPSDRTGPPNARSSNALPPDAVFAMAQDDRGTVYFATRRGLYAAGADGRDPHLVILPGRAPNSSVGAVAVLGGILWVGGEDDGLWGYRPGPGGTLSPAYRPSDFTGFTDIGITVILPDAGHGLWVGTRDGLNRVDLLTHRPAARQVEHIPADAANPDDANALPARYVTALLFDRQGRLWVGTLGGGIAVLTGHDAGGRPLFHRLGLTSGLPHLNIDSMALDGAGTVWAGTDDGLARVDPATLAVRAVRRADGSALLDYFVGAGTTDSAGEAVFGAKGGITVVRPGTLPPWRFQPPLVVTDLQVGGQPVPPDRFNHQGARPPAPLLLPPGRDSLAVEFSALDFSAPQRNRYAYRLDGFDHEWTRTDTSRRLAVYTNLPPGDYTLRLRGSNRAGQWVEKPLSLPIRVLPAWYQRLWARLLAVATAALGVALLVRWRTAVLRHRQSTLERKIALRTADLRAANERLAQLAMTDPLTGCANRRHFMERALDMIALANRHGAPLSLAILDLDDFKAVNDSYGHPGGDAVLATAGRLLRAHLRATDLIGRIGGEEFALLMPHTPADGAMMLADRLREAMGQAETEIDDARIRVTASLGVAELREREDFDSLYSRADTALYMAKHHGRNRVELEIAE